MTPTAYLRAGVLTDKINKLNSAIACVKRDGATRSFLTSESTRKVVQTLVLADLTEQLEQLQDEFDKL